MAQKIKPKLMERLARCMGVRVTPTVEHLTPTTAHLYLGDCKVFRVEALDINPQQQQQQPQGQQPGAAPVTGQPPQQHPPAAGQEPGTVAMAGEGGAGRLAGQEAPQPAPSQPAPEPPKAFTSLSAAMMMKALGSGPNAAAAVAAVSAGGGGSSASSSLTSFPSPSSNPVPLGGWSMGPIVERQAAAAAAAAASSTSSSQPAGAQPPAGQQPPHGPGAAGRPGAPGTGGGAPPAGPAGAAPPPPPQVTLMYFEGCRPITATVLLKGAGLELARRLKAVLGFAVLTAWNARLEAAFLADHLTAAVVAAGEEGARGA